MSSNGSSERARIVIGAVVGAIAAFLIGYILSAAFSALGLALITASDAVRPSTGSFLARTGLNLYAIHHIEINGGGLPGGPTDAVLSINWPITMWAIIPAIALLAGGRISARLSRTEGPGRILAGALTALPYMIILVALRPLFAIPSVSISLPTLPVPGLEFDPGLVTALLSPALDSTILSGLLFGITFGALGAAEMRRLFSQNSSPSWTRSALFSLIMGHIVFLLLLALASSFGIGANSDVDDKNEHGRQMRAWATILPTVSGSLYYLSHGVTLKGEYIVKPGIPEAKPIVQQYRAGLVSGIVAEGKKQSVPSWAYIIGLIPALMLILGGYIAAKNATKPYSAFGLAAGFAASYALFLTAFSTFYKLILRTEVATGEFSTWTTTTIGPSAAQSFVFGLVLAFIFGLIGVIIYRPNAHP